ncbi:MAG: hypothetical protein KKI12_04855 [Proteobacteria bacterium]|nr:hypothetical protein [Pseudomonadota bacterium]MBU4287486.1 hypothetical protein [Pseudomonadota bacterium]MCG2757199.1 hypothetical protein [Desulfobacteraceae bacterium]
MQLQIFEYEKEQEVRTVEIDGEVWWVARDICAVLNLDSSHKVVERLDEDERKTFPVIDSMGREQKTWIVNEPGLYRLLFRSNKPEARKFQKWVYHEVLPQIRKTGVFKLRGYAMPAFIKRFNENWDRVDTGYFSVISELVIRIYGRLEMAGYNMPDKSKKGKEIRPDVSVGKLFPKWLEKRSPEKINKFKMYNHKLPEGMEISEVEARQYELMVLPEFIEYVDTVWLKERSYKYFQERDEKALDYLPKLIPDFKSPRGKTSHRKIGNSKKS